MPYSVGKDPYLDKNTGVLRNLLGNMTTASLDETEADIASSEIAIIEQNKLQPANLDYAFYLSLHKQIFGAIYDWAGQLRTVEVSKGNTSFARVQYLQTNLQELFEELRQDNYLNGLAHDELINGLAYYYGELNVLHPFREGNGRTNRTFLSVLAASHGYHIAWDQMDPAENVAASIASYNGNEAPMQLLLRPLVVQ